MVVGLWNAVLFAPFQVMAEEPGITGPLGAQLNAAAEGAGVSQQTTRPGEIVAGIIKATLSVIGILLVALLVYGGYLWMTAGGEEEKITQAKQIIRNAIIGIAIVLAAYTISVFVVNRLLYATRGQITVP
jgi:cytochrome bd-type quinol oxidase subunit 2